MSGARRRGRSVDDSGEDRAAKREKTGADAATTTAKTTPSLKFTLKKSSSIVDGAEPVTREDDGGAIKGCKTGSIGGYQDVPTEDVIIESVTVSED